MFIDTLLISTSAKVIGGTPVFINTKVPVQTFLDYIKAGKSVDDFLAGFPTVTRKQIIFFLEELGRTYLTVAA